MRLPKHGWPSGVCGPAARPPALGPTPSPERPSPTVARQKQVLEGRPHKLAKGTVLDIPGKGAGQRRKHANGIKPATRREVHGRKVASLTPVIVSLFALIGICGAQSVSPNLEFTHYFGGLGGIAIPVAVATDPKGNIYVAGSATSDGLPTVNALQPNYSFADCGPFQNDLCPDAFAGKLRADGTGFEFLTYLGGPDADGVSDIAVGSEGDVYLLGSVELPPQFPVHLGVEPENTEERRAQVLKLAADGSRIMYATALPCRDCSAVSLAVDAEGAAHIVGLVLGSDFPEINGLGQEPGEMDVFRSDDGGKSWIVDNRGLRDIFGTFRVVRTGKAPFGSSVIYAATRGAVFRKSGRAAPWQRLVTPWITGGNRVRSLVLNPNNSNIVYVATDRGSLSGSGSGVFFSDNGGQTWLSLSDELLEAAVEIRSVALASSRPSTVYVGARTNVFRSDDGGFTWVPTRLAEEVSPLVWVNGLEVDPLDPDTVYARVNRGYPASGNEVFMTRDGGLTWRLTFDLTGPFVIDPVTPTTFYHGTPEGVLKSTDGGRYWVNRSVGIDRENRGVHFLTIDPRDPLTLYGVVRSGSESIVLKTTDGAETWIQLNPIRVRDITSVAIDPHIPGTLYAFGHSNPSNAFVLKLDPDGSRIEYSTLLGGSSGDTAFGIAIDSAGRAYVAGRTSSVDFPAIEDAYLPPEDGYLARLSRGGMILERAVFLGGLRTTKLRFGQDGDLLVVGRSSDDDAVVARINPETLETIGRATLGGSKQDTAWAVVAASDGRTCAGGSTFSDDLPVTTQNAPLPNARGFLACWSKEMELDYATYIDSRMNLVADGQGRIVLAGLGQSGLSPLTTIDNSDHLRPVGLTPYVTRFDFSLRHEEPGLTAVANAARLSPGTLAPGLILSLFGRRMGPPDGASAFVTNGQLPFELAGTQVIIAGRPAPLLFVSDRQINTIAPFELLSGSQVGTQVLHNGAASETIYLTAIAAAPALFTLDGSGTGRAAVINQDGAINGPSNPAPRGSVVQMFGTGGGATSPVLTDGLIQPLDPPFSTLELPVQVEIGRRQAEVLYSGAAPGLVAGVIQINARVPSDVTPRDTASVAIRVGESPEDRSQRVWIAVE